MRVSDFKVLGLEVVENLLCRADTKGLVQKEQQHLYFLTLKAIQLADNLLLSFYCCSFESMLHGLRLHSRKESLHLHCNKDHQLPSVLPR